MTTPLHILPISPAKPLLAALAVACALAADAAKPIPAPFWGDPTLQVERTGTTSRSLDFASLFVDADGLTELTVCGWFRSTTTNDNVNLPFVVFACSNVPARSTAEGGPPLADLTSTGSLTGDYLPLGSDGTWAATCLTDYALPPGMCSQPGQFQYGYYSVNISTDKPLTLNVGGSEVEVPVTNFWSFGILATSASRAVSIAASDPSAHVRFGIGENPLVQFVPAQFDQLDSEGMGSDGSLGVIATNEWRFVVARARIDGGTNLAVHACGYSRTAKFQNEQSVARTLWKPSATFARNARVRVLFGRFGGMAGVTIHSWGLRAYGYYLPDALVERMRDQDWTEMTRRGIVPIP